MLQKKSGSRYSNKCGMMIIILITKVKVTQSCLFVIPWIIQPMEFSRPEYWRRGILSLLQVIFPTQGLNPVLPHCKWILYLLNHQGNPWVILADLLRKLTKDRLTGKKQNSHAWRSPRNETPKVTKAGCLQICFRQKTVIFKDLAEQRCLCIG